jgi:hypothetical protein
MESFLLNIGFTKSQANIDKYVKQISVAFLSIGLYVDNTILVNNDLVWLPFTKVSNHFQTSHKHEYFTLGLHVLFPQNIFFM